LAVQRLSISISRKSKRPKNAAGASPLPDQTSVFRWFFFIYSSMLTARLGQLRGLGKISKIIF
jgi:hypothetical protein